jgi:hypothetical protein
MQVRHYQLELVGVFWRQESAGGDSGDSGLAVELREVVVEGVIRELGG